MLLALESLALVLLTLSRSTIGVRVINERKIKLNFAKLEAKMYSRYQKLGVWVQSGVQFRASASWIPSMASSDDASN